MTIETAIDEYLTDQPAAVRADSVVREFVRHYLGTTDAVAVEEPGIIVQLNQALMGLPDLDLNDGSRDTMQGKDVIQDLWLTLLTRRILELDE
ncbi:hypothetical protein [Subtercola sp. RTI3]|uniref:hypothetical protein n=1 Tax=Subtercola sp. RTI3 TaxID=3048639 RepID=UPI002B23A022|nr:hypothetical protein [Subtercola sp. RTI3]MEA9986089.1 hypothetical protein [Subtercola sp. RTI3]